jgi:hypothetical protein
MSGEKGPVLGERSDPPADLAVAPAVKPSYLNTPMGHYERESERRRRGGLGKSQTRHREEIFEEDERERESTPFISGFGISKEEMMFNKWVNRSLDTDDIDFTNIGKLQVKSKTGVYVSPEQRKMLAIYFNMCYLSTVSQASDANGKKAKKEYELLRRRYDASTPYELSARIYSKMKAREDLETENEYYEMYKNTDSIRRTLA